MFEIPQPSMALNAANVPPPDYRMWNTYKVAADDESTHVIGWASVVAKSLDSGLKCLVLNSHGIPGKLLMGNGIDLSDAGLFSQMNGKVNSIFIVACQVAKSQGSVDGNLLCTGIAKAAGAHVFCSTDFQSTGLYGLIGLPVGTIDEYEGPIRRYDPDGSIKVVSNDDITTWLRNLKLGVSHSW
jgi:hypothetical protein